MQATAGKPFIVAEEIAWESVDNGIDRKIIGYDDQLMMVCVRFKKVLLAVFTIIFTGRYRIYRPGVLK